jgi:mercuric reductase
VPYSATAIWTPEFGGSYIALEMAQAYQRLGSAVTVIQKAAELSEREDVADELRAALERDGRRDSQR